MRVEIEEIDYDEVKTKLNEAVAKTTATQSAEKKRIIAQDNQMFDQFMTAGGDGPSGEQKHHQRKDADHQHESNIQNANEETDVRNKNTQQSFFSPSDIGRSVQGSTTIPKANSTSKTIKSSPDTVRLNLSQVTKSAKPAKSSPQQSLRTSPRAPVNSYQFQRDWQSVKGDLDQVYDYLKVRFYIKIKR